MGRRDVAVAAAPRLRVRHRRRARTPRATARNACAACERSPSLAIDEPQLPRRSQFRHAHLGQLAARDFALRAASRQERDAQAHLDRALDAIEARQRHADVERRVALLVQAQHAIARR